MGTDKALLEVGGRPLAAIVAAALRGAGAAEVLAVGGDGPRLAGLGLRAVPDASPGEGPLGGLITALAEAGNDLVAVLACDLPGATAAAVAAVVDALAARPAAGVAVPSAGGRLHPLHAAWRRSVAADHLARAFSAGERAVHPLLAVVGMVTVEGIDPVALRDADTVEDLGTIGT